MAAARPPATALHRFGLGARPGDINAWKSDPVGALAAQFEAGATSTLDADLPTLAETVSIARASREKLQQLAKRNAAGEIGEDDIRAMRRKGGGPLGGLPIREGLARMKRAATGADGYRERMVLFWANWFTMAAVNPPTAALAGIFERQAIRPHVGGRFKDMLKAAVLHPGMLVYLDNVRSAGPNSLAGRVRDFGLNENLAREVLELHTLGADGGYSQDDVIEFAKALTGWTVDIRPRGPRAGTGEARFEARMHEPGARRVLGKIYPEGEDQAVRILDDLAARPETAARVARRLAAHLVADTPPGDLVAHLERTFRDTDGDLAALAKAAITHEAAWTTDARKLRTPYEFVIASLRALDVFPESDPEILFGTLAELGQPLFRAPSPEGWPDDAASWAGPDGLKRRIAWANAAARRMDRRLNPLIRAREILGARLSSETAFSVGGAEDGVQGLVLFLLSPDMMWR